MPGKIYQIRARVRVTPKALPSVQTFTLRATSLTEGAARDRAEIIVRAKK